MHVDPAPLPAVAQNDPPHGDQRATPVDTRGLRRVFVVGAPMVAALASVWHLCAPGDASETLVSVIAIVGLLTVAVGPHLRGARPTGLWLWVTVGSILSIAAALLDPFSAPGRLGVSDLLFIAGYVCYLAWFSGMARIVGHARGVPLLLDTLVAVSAIMLGLWTVPALGPDKVDLAAGAIWGLYPLLDAMNLVLVGHLAFRSERRSSAWTILFWALVMLLLTDLTLAVAAVTDLDVVRRVGTAMAPFPYVALALAATAPGVVDLTREAAPAQRAGPIWRSALVYTAILPGVASLAIPGATSVDLPIRAILVGILLLLMLTRLLRTLGEVGRAEARSRVLADHDPLTGLLTRSALLVELERRIPLDSVTATSTGVLFLDIDRFKAVNDMWGHTAGDTLLAAIADRLSAGVREGDVVARHGGDEFVVVAGVESPAEATALAERLLELFAAPFEIRPGLAVPVSGSIGVSVSSPAGRATSVDLLEQADIALFAAKNGGRARHSLYDAGLDEETRHTSRLVEALREAVAHDRIDIAFQPVHGGRGFTHLVGWESLARWHDPDLGQVPPDVFIALAEKLGLIDLLGRQVLRKSCLALAELRKEPAFAQAHVAVNVSALQLHRPTFADLVVETLAETGLPEEAVMIEITESVLISATSPVHEAVARLRAAGLRVAIDDFGTGFSSITALLTLPVDCVKIDRSLVRDLEEGPEAVAQLRAVIDLVTSLDIDLVIAEGVETEQQAEVVAGTGCPMVQGYLFGRPVDPREVTPSSDRHRPSSTETTPAGDRRTASR